MKNRGKAITNSYRSAIKKANREINEYVGSSEGRKEMNTILSAFITFKTEAGHDEAQNYIKNPMKFVVADRSSGAEAEAEMSIAEKLRQRLK